LGITQGQEEDCNSTVLYIARFRPEMQGRCSKKGRFAGSKGVGCLFLRQDPGAVLFREWSAHQDEIEYSYNDSWDHML